MSGTVIYTDQTDPNGRTIHYNVDEGTRTVASEVNRCIAEGELVEVPNEDGGEPIFVHPDHVATVSPPKKKED